MAFLNLLYTLGAIGLCIIAWCLYQLYKTNHLEVEQ